MRIVLITCLIFLVGITETRAQEILIPYRTGNQWGLADTMGSIKLTPRYDTLINPLFRASSYRQSTFYIFKKAGKQGLTSANAEILPPEHKLLQYAAGSFIRSLVSDAPKIEHGYGLWKYYTLNGDLVTNDTLFNVFYNYDIRLSFPGHFSLAAARLKNKNYTIYLVDREEDKVIQTLISNVTSYNYINKKRYLVLLEIETNSNIKLNYELSYNSILKKIEMKKVPLKKEEEEEYEMDEIAADEYGIYDSEYYEIEEGESATKKGKLAEIVIFGFEHKKLVMKTFVGQVDRMSNQSELRLAQVKVFPKIKEKNTQIKGYETNIDKRSSNAFKDKSGDLVYQNNYAMYLKQGLIGIVTKYGQINPQFKTVLGIGAKFDKGDIPSFIVSKMIEGKEKFGIVSANGKYLVPLGYDSLILVNSRANGNVIGAEKRLGFIKAKKNEKWYLLNKYYELIFPAGYDRIEIEDNSLHNVHLINDNKYGFWNGYEGIGKIYISPTYNYRVNGFKRFARYKVVKLVNEKKQFVGFADFKGFYYFD